MPGPFSKVCGVKQEHHRPKRRDPRDDANECHPNHHKKKKHHRHHHPCGN
jgi:hypothetical protein